MERRYFFLNIQLSGDSADDGGQWLERHQAPVFFGQITLDDVRAGRDRENIGTRNMNALESFLSVNERAKSAGFEPLFVTIASGRLWIYRPIGAPLEDAPQQRSTGEKVLPKYFNIDGCKCIPLATAPFILANMKANQAFSRGTFREIDLEKYEGNIAAIQSVYGWEDGFQVDPLDCLSSVEFETLVAKIFEAEGCFVPAHRGGVLKDVDFFVQPPRDGHVMPSLFKGGLIKRLLVQVKIKTLPDKQQALKAWLGNQKEKDESRILISLEERVPQELDGLGDVFLGREWIRDRVKRNESIRDWLLRSLDWLPPDRRSCDI